VKFVEAIQKALDDAMSDNDAVVVLGEDVAVDGGVFRATDGLWKKFGGDRVIDTPLAEGGITGLSIGLATQGIKPVAEIQFMGFSYPCLDQLANHASRFRNRTRGRLSCPMVLRIPYGGGIHAPEHHSESIEAMFAHIPGLRVLVPSSPAKAYGLLRAAIENPDPVVFLEPKKLYQTEQPNDEISFEFLPLDKVDVVQSGTDLTLLTWGAMLPDCLAAAQQMAVENIAVELIDAAALSILDMASITTSVEKTGRCVIVHEAVGNGGFGAEISARLAEQSILSLRSPIRRVAGYDTVMPLPQLEQYYMPNETDILQACHDVMEYS